MQLALTLGMGKFYKHLELYGLTEKTGVDYPAESPSIVSDPDTIGPVEFAEMGFGQAIAITPMQLIIKVTFADVAGVDEAKEELQTTTSPRRTPAW